MTKTDWIMLPIMGALLAFLLVSVKVGLDREAERVYSYSWRCCNEAGQAYRIVDLQKASQ